MKQEVFIGIINAIMDQKEREEQFSENIKKAYVSAGECEDFRASDSYLPPTSKLVDELILALAAEFVSVNQTYDSAADLINYYIYELKMMNYSFMEPIDPEKNTFEVHPVPVYITHQNGTKLLMSDPASLYQALVYCQDTPAVQEPTKVSGDTHIQSIIHQDSEEKEVEEEFHFDNEKQEEIWAKMKPVIEDKLAMDDIIPTDQLAWDLNADSLDQAELVMDIETAFGVHFTDSDYSSVEDATHCYDLVRLVEKRLK